MTAGKLDLIVACDRNRGIGKNGGLPWHLPGDLKYFAQTTTDKQDGAPDNVVIMGGKTWQSIPAKFRPLKNRVNIVLTRGSLTAPLAADPLAGKAHEAGRLAFVSTLDQALELAWLRFQAGRCFVIGGASLYEQAIEHGACHLLYMTEIEATFDCDVFFPQFLQKFVPISHSDPQMDNGIRYSFNVYERTRG